MTERWLMSQEEPCSSAEVLAEIAAGSNTLWNDSHVSFPPHLDMDGSSNSTTPIAAVTSASKSDGSDHTFDEKGVHPQTHVVLGLDLLMTFDQTPPPPPVRPLPATPVQPQQLPPIEKQVDAPKPKKERKNKRKQISSAATAAATSASGSSFQEAFAEPDRLPQGHRPARGRRRPKQLAMMSQQQIAAENEQRMEKNRQLARDGRLRKKASVDSLRQRVQQADARNKRQLKTIAKAQKEIAKLKQLLRLQRPKQLVKHEAAEEMHVSAHEQNC